MVEENKESVRMIDFDIPTEERTPDQISTMASMQNVSTNTLNPVESSVAATQPSITGGEKMSNAK